MKKECDNCSKEDKFNGWKYNEKGVQVFLCGKCDKEDVISKNIFKNKLEVKNGASGNPKNTEKAIT